MTDIGKNLPARNTVAVVLAALAATAVAGTSFWRSFTAIAELAVSYRVPIDQAWMIPVAVDGLVVVATVAAAVSRHRVARGYSWFLLVAGTIVSVAGNGIHAWQLTESPIGVGIAVLPPLVTLAAVHLTILLARQGDETTTRAENMPEDIPTDGATCNDSGLAQKNEGQRPVTRLRVAPATAIEPAATPTTTTLETLSLDVAPATDEERRAAAIRLVVDEKMSVRAAGAQLGVSKDKVHRWVAAHRATLAATG